MEILKEASAVKDYKAHSKGKFPEHCAQGPGENFIKDISWIHKANPEAHKAERDYLARDEFLMEKRRFQKII